MKVESFLRTNSTTSLVSANIPGNANKENKIVTYTKTCADTLYRCYKENEAQQGYLLHHRQARKKLLHIIDDRNEGYIIRSIKQNKSISNTTHKQVPKKKNSFLHITGTGHCYTKESEG